MTFSEIQNLLDKVPPLLYSLDDANFTEKMITVTSIGEKIKYFKNELFSPDSTYSETEKKTFTDKTKLIREIFDNTLKDRKAEIEQISLDIQRIKMVQTAKKYRNI